jgi:capsular polysaccharide export protein
VPAKNYLLLQGPVGPFFSQLGIRLLDAGHRVHRIHFNGGDRIFWKCSKAVSVDYRDHLDQWPDFLAVHLSKWNITDVLLFGDCRPLHREAVRLARLRGLRVHVFEEGYLRPNWVTLEHGGVNGYSSLPRDSSGLQQAAANLPEWTGGIPVRNDFLRRAFEDVIYNCALVLAGSYYRGFRTHRPWHPFVEYAAGAKRFFRKPQSRKLAAAQIERLLGSAQPYYLFPLQLDADSQIRYHSPFGRMAPAIEKVITSFAHAAPSNTFLVITEHPLDNAVVDQRIVAERCAFRYGITSRVLYLQGGSPDVLVQKCRGLVTINSTIGVLGLGFGVGVKTLGEAIYDLPKLSFQGDLDDFWKSPTPADPLTFDGFRRVVAAQTQINGGFYSREGVQLAVEGTLRRLLTEVTSPDSAQYEASNRSSLLQASIGDIIITPDNSETITTPLPTTERRVSTVLEFSAASPSDRLK